MLAWIKFFLYQSSGRAVLRQCVLPSYRAVTILLYLLQNCSHVPWQKSFYAWKILSVFMNFSFESATHCLSYVTFLSWSPVHMLLIGSFSKWERVGRAPSSHVPAAAGRAERRSRPQSLWNMLQKSSVTAAALGLFPSGKGLYQIILISPMVRFETNYVKIIKISLGQLLF